MTGELGRYLLGSGALTLIIVALVQGVLKLHENRTTLKNTMLTREHEDELKAEMWNAAYRAAAEQHLPFDLAVQQEIRELRNEVNDLRRAMKWQPREFLPMPPPPPLFPRREDLKGP